MPRSKIAGIGKYVPANVVTNHDLTQYMDTNDEWIQERTGIKERRIAGPEMATSDMATNAALKAMEAAGAVETRPGDDDPAAIALLRRLAGVSRKRWPATAVEAPRRLPA